MGQSRLEKLAHRQAYGVIKMPGHKPNGFFRTLIDLT
jgi:hypothetical protein